MEKEFTIKDEGLVEVDGEKTISFSKFKKFIYKNILESAVRWDFCDDNSFKIVYEDRLGYDKNIYVRFSNPNIVTDNGQKFNDLTNPEKQIYLNYLKKNKPRMNIKRIFSSMYFESEDAICLILVCSFFAGASYIGLLMAGALKYFPILLGLSFFGPTQSFIYNQELAEYLEVREKKTIRKHKINYLSKELSLAKANEYMAEKEEDLIKERNFNDGVLEEIYVLLDEVSIVNGKDRDIVIDKIKLILKDYLTKLKELKENQASFGYDERCVYLKKETFKKIAKLKMEISMLQKSSKQEQILNNDIDVIEEKIESLSSDKKVRVRKKTK